MKNRLNSLTNKQPPLTVDKINQQLRQAFQLPYKKSHLSLDDVVSCMDNCIIFVDSDRIKTIGEILQYIIYNENNEMSLSTSFDIFLLGMNPKKDKVFFEKINLRVSKTILASLKLILISETLKFNKELLLEIITYWIQKCAQ